MKQVLGGRLAFPISLCLFFPSLSTCLFIAVILLRNLSLFSHLTVHLLSFIPWKILCECWSLSQMRDAVFSAAVVEVNDAMSVILTWTDVLHESICQMNKSECWHLLCVCVFTKMVKLIRTFSSASEFIALHWSLFCGLINTWVCVTCLCGAVPSHGPNH